MSVSTDEQQTIIVQPKRHWSQLGLLILAWALGVSGYLLTELNIHDDLPTNWQVIVGGWLAVVLACHLVTRFAIPYALSLIHI